MSAPDTHASVRALSSGDRRLAIIGLGYLGYTNLLRFAAAGIRCAATDFSPARLADFAAGTYPAANRFAYWKALAELNYGRPEGTRPFDVVAPDRIVTPDTAACLVCVPFDAGSGLLSDDMRQTLELLRTVRGAGADRPIVVFEPFLRPYTMAKRVIPELTRLGVRLGQDFTLAYAPRQDWFLEEFERGAKRRRVAYLGAGGDAAVAGLFGLIGQQVTVSTDFTAVELAECVENAMLFLAQSLVNQTMFAYPEEDVRAVAAMLDPGTLQVRPGVSSAGSKASLGAQFLVDAAPSSGYLTLVADALSSGFSAQQRIVELLKRRGVRSVAVLGLVPHENTAEYRSDPAVLVPQLLARAGMRVTAHDPFLTAGEIRDLAGCEAVAFPEGLRGVEAVIVLTSHSAYRLAGRAALVQSLEGCRVILDNAGVWAGAGLADAGIEYRVIGAPASLTDGGEPLCAV